MIKLSHIPSILVGMRFALAPLLVFDALDHRTSFWFIISFVIAVLTDIFDGIIARRLKVSTAKLRQADSWADILTSIQCFGRTKILLRNGCLPFI